MWQINKLKKRNDGFMGTIDGVLIKKIESFVLTPPGLVTTTEIKDNTLHLLPPYAATSLSTKELLMK